MRGLASHATALTDRFFVIPPKLLWLAEQPEIQAAS
jgi:hypothetical protein